MVTTIAVMCLGFLKPSLVGMRSFIGKPYLGGSSWSAKRKVSRVCGCSAVAMSMLQIAMMGKVPYPAIKEAIFAHPTLAESLNNLFMTLDPR